MRLAPRVAMTVALLSAVAAQYAVLPALAAAGQATANYQSSATTKVPVTPGKTSSFNQNSVDMRLGRLEDEVRLARQAGRLTSEESETLRLSALRAISDEEADYLAVVGKVPPAAELNLQLSLDRLERTILSSFHDRKIATLDLGGRETLLYARIHSAETTKRLSDSDAAALRRRLDGIIADQRLKAGAGKVSYGDALLTSLHLDSLVADFAHALHHRPFAVPDVQALRAQVEQLEKKESKEGMDRLQSVSLQFNRPLPDIAKFNTKAAGEAAVDQAAQLEWLQALLEEDQSGKTVALDPATEETRVDHAIATALDNGRLSPTEAEQLRSDLEVITSRRQALSATGEKLTPVQQAQLAMALARLSGHVEREQHQPTPLWSGINGYQASLDERINDGVGAKRLTEDQVRDLKAAADKIAQAEAEYRATAGGITGKQALALVMQLQSLNVQLHHDLKDRGVKAPDLDKLQSNLEKTITEGVELGKLDYNSKLVDQLNHLTQLKQAYSSSAEGLDDRARLAIGEAIEHNSAQLKAEVHRDETERPASLSMRLSALTKDISAAAVSGVMSVDRAGQYKAAVDTIYGDLLEARKAPGAMTPAKTMAIANDVDALRDQFDDEMREGATLPQHLVPRLRALAVRVGTLLADERISLRQASELIAELDANAERLVAASVSQGGLSHGEGLRIAFDIERIANRMESAVHDEPVRLAENAQRPGDIDNKVANALASGRISLDEAKQLRAGIDKVVADKRAFARSDHGLSYPESLALAMEWDSMAQTVAQAKSTDNKPEDISARRTNLERRVKELQAQGKLTNKDAGAITDELDRLAQTEADFRMSDEKLDLGEVITIASTLDHLSAKVDTLAKGQLSLKEKR